MVVAKIFGNRQEKLWRVSTSSLIVGLCVWRILARVQYSLIPLVLTRHKHTHTPKIIHTHPTQLFYKLMAPHRHESQQL